MIPKHHRDRLSSSMQPMTSDWQTWQPPQNLAAFEATKESKLKLNLETRNHGDVFIVHCHGRIVYRDEAAALAEVVAEILDRSGKLVLDLTGVTSIDSAGIGELALFHNRAQEKNVVFKCAGAN